MRDLRGFRNCSCVYPGLKNSFGLDKTIVDFDDLLSGPVICRFPENNCYSFKNDLRTAWVTSGCADFASILFPDMKFLEGDNNNWMRLAFLLGEHGIRFLNIREFLILIKSYPILSFPHKFVLLDFNLSSSFIFCSKHGCGWNMRKVPWEDCLEIKDCFALPVSAV